MSAAVSPVASTQSVPDSGAVASSGGTTKEQASSGPISVPKLLRAKKLTVRRSSHKAADLGIGDLDTTSVSKSVEEVPVDSANTIQPKPSVEEDPLNKPVEVEVDKGAAGSIDLQTADQEKAADIVPDVEQSVRENLQEEPHLTAEETLHHEEKILNYEKFLNRQLQEIASLQGKLEKLESEHKAEVDLLQGRVDTLETDRATLLERNMAL